tara:strand:- start:388 stop:627 length:240 start_codon:yes stop_codon:yes gene_type:complete
MRATGVCGNPFCFAMGGSLFADLLRIFCRFDMAPFRCGGGGCGGGGSVPRTTYPPIILRTAYLPFLPALPTCTSYMNEY